jgi:HEAT repeat protein
VAAAIRHEGTPRRNIEALVDELGRADVVRNCIGLLAGREVDGAIILALGGPPARWAVDGGASGPDYWLRVWALRGLLWVWSDDATSAVVGAMSDDSWRVREMAAKVAARHLVDDALAQLIELRDDPVPRVRIAATGAIKNLAAGASSTARSRES